MLWKQVTRIHISFGCECHCGYTPEHHAGLSQQPCHGGELLVFTSALVVGVASGGACSRCGHTTGIMQDHLSRHLVENRHLSGIQAPVSASKGFP